MRISETPKLKDMDMEVTLGQVVISNGILEYMDHTHGGADKPWLHNNYVGQGRADTLLKIKYSERHLNSLGQYMCKDIEKFKDGCEMLYGMHEEEWDRLWASYIAEYNPIWNVDAEETTTETRDLEDNHTGTDTMGQTGTITNAKSGTDTVAMTGTDANAKTGTDTVAMTGTDANAKSGYDTLTRTGTDAVAKTGSENTHTDYITNNDYIIDIDGTETGTDTMVKSGSETNVHSGSINNTGTETTAHKIFGFNSTNGSDADSTTRTPNLTETFNNETNNLTFNNRQDQETKNLSNTHDEHRDDIKDEDTDTTLSFTNRTDTETLNLTDKNTYNSTDTETKNLQDQTTYASTETETRNMQDQTTYASSNTETFAKTDTNTKALKDTQEGTITTIYERHGNIGVTMTQQMLEADRDYWLSALSLFYENVIKDIINDLCYKIQVDEYI